MRECLKYILKRQNLLLLLSIIVLAVGEVFLWPNIISLWTNDQIYNIALFFIGIIFFCIGAVYVVFIVKKKISALDLAKKKQIIKLLFIFIVVEVCISIFQGILSLILYESLHLKLESTKNIISCITSVSQNFARVILLYFFCRTYYTCKYHFEKSLLIKTSVAILFCVAVSILIMILPFSFLYLIQNIWEVAFLLIFLVFFSFKFGGATNE